MTAVLCEVAFRSRWRRLYWALGLVDKQGLALGFLVLISRVRYAPVEVSSGRGLASVVPGRYLQARFELMRGRRPQGMASTVRLADRQALERELRSRASKAADFHRARGARAPEI